MDWSRGDSSWRHPWEVVSTQLQAGDLSLDELDIGVVFTGSDRISAIRQWLRRFH